MTHIRLIEPQAANPVIKILFWFAQRATGQLTGKRILPSSLKAHAHHTHLLFGLGMMESAQMHAVTVPKRLKSLASLKVAALIGCPFCMDIGSAVGRRDGVREDQLAELHRFTVSGAFDEIEKVVLRYAEALTQSRVQIPDELFAMLRQYFTEQQLVELTSAITWENYRARFNRGLAIEPDGFIEGATCVLPQFNQSL
jgi:4-carboxymuconolactone decarboxylase